MKVLVLDNYDSFTYNLVHYLKELTDAQVDVYRNDKISLEEVATYDKILLSPGPGIPEDAGILKELIAKYGTSKSIFGVCLGVQAMAEVYGGKIKNMNQVFHGIATPVLKTEVEEHVLEGLSDKFMAGRYHSWVVDSEGLPEELQVTAVDESGEIMALKHRDYDVRGVQFHPESVLTPEGKMILKNWLNQK
ncbi:aminodeoxychorismate/anthranilate synthase component II [Prolixibacteraceae bacterium JC049]|nr:aminodeoxychorismate/anthranilate synthase component II [Prolixibacteraceae bacterium JC049]